MSKRIITISREFGSGGRYIGAEVAKRLGIAFYDKDIIASIAEKTGLSQEYIEQKGERAPFKSIFAYGLVGRNASGQSMDDILYNAQREFLLEKAEAEPCVIVGRNADYILRERTDCINVFIHGDMPVKTERIMKLHDISRDEAEKLIHDVDKRRSINYKYYTEQRWGQSQNYTISLNSSQLGYEMCEKIIIELYGQE